MCANVLSCLTFPPFSKAGSAPPIFDDTEGTSPSLSPLFVAFDYRRVYSRSPGLGPFQHSVTGGERCKERERAKKATTATATTSHALRTILSINTKCKCRPSRPRTLGRDPSAIPPTLGHHRLSFFCFPFVLSNLAYCL